MSEIVKNAAEAVLVLVGSFIIGTAVLAHNKINSCGKVANSSGPVAGETPKK